RKRDQRAERGRDQRREDRDLEADLQRAREPRVGERMLPVLEREPLPRVVERERDDDRDRQEEVREREERVRVEDAMPQLPDHRPAAAPMSRSVPTSFENTTTSTRIAPMRTNESAAAVG